MSRSPSLWLGGPSTKLVCTCLLSICMRCSFGSERVLIVTLVWITDASDSELRSESSRMHLGSLAQILSNLAFSLSMLLISLGLSVPLWMVASLSLSMLRTEPLLPVI